MKTQKLLMLILFVMLCSFVPAQTPIIGDKVGAWKSTDTRILGNDDSNLYSLRIDKVKRDKFGYFEAFSLSEMKKVYSVPLNPADIDENLKEIQAAYYTKAGLALFYVSYDSKANTKTLRVAVLDSVKRKSWVTKDVTVVQDVKSEITVSFIIRQLKDGGVLIFAKRYKGPSYNLVTDTRTVVTYLDNTLQEVFNHEELLEFKNGDLYDGYVDANKNIYVFYRATTLGALSETAKYMFINTKTGEVKNADFWDYDKKDRKRKEIFPKNVFCVNNEDGGVILVSTYHYHNSNLYTNSSGLAIVKFGVEGNVLSKETVQWPTKKENGFMGKDEYVVFMNINSVSIDKDHSLNITSSMEYDMFEAYSAGLRISGIIANLRVMNSSIQAFSYKDKGLSYGTETEKNYSGEAYIVNQSKTYAFYNQDKEVLANREAVRVKDIYSMSKGAMSVFNADGTTTEIDLHLSCQGDNECQLLPQQNVVLKDQELITLMAAGDYLYFVKLKP